MIIVFHSTDVIPFLECFILDGMRIFGIPSKQFIRRTFPPKGNSVAVMIRTLIMVVSLSECQLISLFVGFWRLSNKNRSPLKTSSEILGKALGQSSLSRMDRKVTLPLQQTLKQDSLITSHYHSESTQQTFCQLSSAFPSVYCIGDGWAG